MNENALVALGAVVCTRRLEVAALDTVADRLLHGLALRQAIVSAQYLGLLLVIIARQRRVLDSLL